MFKRLAIQTKAAPSFLPDVKSIEAWVAANYGRKLFKSPNGNNSSGREFYVEDPKAVDGLDLGISIGRTGKFYAFLIFNQGEEDEEYAHSAKFQSEQELKALIDNAIKTFQTVKNSSQIKAPWKETQW